jgi:CubicO group peptidase (beta-lactamase class C family)
VRHLLNHTGGLPNYTAQAEFRWERSFTPDEILGLVKDKPLEFTPGERMAYSNTGYYLLGTLIEKVSGQGYAEFLARRILKPAGMATARLSGREVVPNRAHGYVVLGQQVLNAPMVLADTAGAAGAILASVEDMAKWEAALTARRLISKASYEQMWAPARLNGGGTSDYALGWVVNDRKGHRVMNHAGGTAGFSSVITRVEPENLTVIVLCNTGMGAAETIASGLVAHYVPDLRPDPPAAAGKDPDPKVTERTRAIVLSLLSEEPDFTPLTEDMRKALTPQMLASLRQQMAMLGPLKAFAYLKDTESPQGHVYLYRATFGEMPLVVTATYDGDGKVAGLFMRPE